MMHRVMIVEDDMAIAQTLTYALRLIPHVDVVRAISGEEALKLWAEQPADVMLTDHHMQGMSGIELVRQLRAQGRTEPMLLVTAYDTTEVQRQAREAGVTDFIGKPFFIDQLLEQVSNLLPRVQSVGN